MKWKLALAATVSGVLLALPWLGGTGLVLLFAFIPLLWLEDYLIRNFSHHSSIAFWTYSLITFFIWNALTTWWIWYATPAGAIFAICTNTLLMSIVWWFAHIARQNRGNGFGNLFLVFCWISFEYLHYHWDLAWPWLNLGNGFANDISFIQWYEYTGVFGGTLWVLLVNLLLWTLLKALYVKIKAIHWLQWLATLTILLFPMLFSMVKFYNYHEDKDPVNVVVAQPNIDPYHDKFSDMSYQEQYNRLLSVSDSLGTDSTDFFVGPETALHEVWLNKWEYSSAIRNVQRFLSDKYPHAAYVVGAMSYLAYPSGEEVPVTARFSKDSTYSYDAFNSAVLIAESGPQSIYHKSKLVAGVEKMPFKRFLGFMDKLVIDLGGTTGTLASLDQPVVFEHKGIKVGVPICYESVFGAYVAGFIKQGAELLFVITNDGWWKDSPGYRQHLAYSRLLAIEFRRSIARSGNTGISCFINQKGQIMASSKWWTKTAISGSVNCNQKLTFYAESGDYIARISVFVFVLMSLLLLTSALQKRT